MLTDGWYSINKLYIRCSIWTYLEMQQYYLQIKNCSKTTVLIRLHLQHRSRHTSAGWVRVMLQVTWQKKNSATHSLMRGAWCMMCVCLFTQLGGTWVSTGQSEKRENEKKIIFNKGRRVKVNTGPRRWAEKPSNSGSSCQTWPETDVYQRCSITAPIRQVWVNRPEWRGRVYTWLWIK